MSQAEVLDARREARDEATVFVAIALALLVLLALLSIRGSWELLGIGGWVWLILCIPELVLLAAFYMSPLDAETRQTRRGVEWLIALVVRAFNRRLRGLTRQTQQAMGDINHVLQESLENQKVVKIFGGQGYEAMRFGQATNRVRRLLMKEQTAAAANVPVVQLLAAIAVAVVIYQVTVEVQAGHTTVGSFVSFIAAMLLVTAPLKRLTSVSVTIDHC